MTARPALAPVRVAVAATLAVACLACTETGAIDLGAILEVPAVSRDQRVASGLREALRIGTQRAVALRSRKGGFAKVPSLRLRLPEEVEPAARALRTVGLGGPVDELEATMNRAAEEAAGEAVPVFADAISSMTIADAFGILNGPDDAATRYFEARTSQSLRARFSPVVEAAMQRVGVYRSYREALRLYETLPFSETIAPDLEAYVLDRTLAGLFRTLAAEEARIREDPAARTTALLREVFGGR